ncbi:hypothetical protein EYF80_047238 [Liparis tanakae]|uniref:Uncharacterized protein n=1 Tax=Liparis tanakae TaxID=230148 RepID=A0A4Z2FN66_9TELE|nr:hypothetical protein EYF80_047238 [Liparis tanakae]
MEGAGAARHPAPGPPIDNQQISLTVTCRASGRRREAPAGKRKRKRMRKRKGKETQSMWFTGNTESEEFIKLFFSVVDSMNPVKKQLSEKPENPNAGFPRAELGFWRLLEASGGFWRLLEASGGFWRLPGSQPPVAAGCISSISSISSIRSIRPLMLHAADY